MHGDVRLGGVVWATLVVFLALGGLLALFVTVDVIRRMRRGGAKPPLWFYLTFEGVYLLILLLAQFAPGFRIGFGAAASLLTPFAIGVGVAYLLRVVYPKQPADADEPGDDAGID